MESYAENNQPEKDPSILIQVEMFKRHPDWISNNAERFREFIDKNPELISRYREDPDSVIDELEKIFYH